MQTLRRVSAVLALLLGCFACLPGFARDIVIYYTSDAHGHIFSDENTVGLDRVAGAARATPGALLLDAGDFLHGRPVAVLTRGRDVVRLMKKAGYTAVTAGNHEFDYGLETLLERSLEARTPPDPIPVLSANVIGSDGLPLLAVETHVRTDGGSVCVFGLTTPETARQVRKSTVRGLRFESPLGTGRRIAAAQKERGCDLVVALTHIGSEAADAQNSRVLGAAVPDIDVVIDGHSHVVLEEALPRPDGRPAVLVSPGAHGELLGRLTVNLDDATGAVTDMRNEFITARQAGRVPVDAELTAELDALRAGRDRQLSVPVGTIDADFSVGGRLARREETAFGDLCADALRAVYGDEMAICNGGGLRHALEKGVVTRGHILNALPFANTVVSVWVTGREVLDMLEHGFSQLPDPTGGFPQVSGLKVRVKPDNPPGFRVVEVVAAGGLLDPDRVYSLTVNDYLADGGDGYPHLAGKRKREDGISVEEAFVSFIRRTDTSAYADGPAGRIVME